MNIDNDIMRERSSLPAGVAMNLTITARQFAAIIGGLLAVAGLVVLFFMPVSVTYDSGLFGAETVDCGTALITNNAYADVPVLACSDALTERRAWGWPLAIGGLVVAVAALFVQSPKIPGDVQTDE